MKIEKLIRNLDIKTLLKAEKFFSSPYHNRRDDLRELFLILKANQVSGKVLTRKEIWQKIYPDKTFNDQILRKRYFEAATILEDFFVVEVSLENRYQRLTSLAQFADENGIGELKHSIDKQIKEDLESSHLYYSHSYINLYQSYLAVLDLDSDFEKKKKNTSSDQISNHLYHLNRLLETYYHIEKMRIALLQNNYSELLGEKIDVIETSQLKENELNPELLDKSQLLSFFNLLFNLLLKSDTAFDIKMCLNFLTQISAENKKEALQLYDYINNFLVRKLNLGENRYAEIFELMKFGLSSRILIKSDQLDPIDYRNAIISACRINEYEWALDFAEKYKQFLPIKYRQSAYSFSKARIFNNMGNHEGVIDILRNVEYEDITYNLNSRLMLIMAFYNLDEFDILISTINAFKVFLRRKRNLSVKRKNNFRDFCDIVYQIVKAEDKKDPQRLSVASEILKTNPGIPSKWWLEQKLQEVEANLGVKKEISDSSLPT